LKNTLQPIKEQMHENYTWKELIDKAFEKNCNLSAMYLRKPDPNDESTKNFVAYDIDAACCTEVLLDVLSGEVEITRTDIMYDCGQT
jgi:xanthine dehydrogenase molybdopterin-binding subunit B